jgi:putative Mg2+ transporter-C (MgtC) family protein
MGDVGLQLEIFGEVLIALLLGGLIGVEREAADKPAGFRTQMMVAGAAALLVGLSDALLASFDAETARGVIQSDPIRIVEAIITGVSFLGAGTIFRRGSSDHVEGLTTAASLLMSAAVGISVALDQVPLAVGVTALSIMVLWGLRVVERRVRRRSAPGA